MTDVTGGSPVSGASAHKPHVLVSVRSALAILSLIALTILVLEIAQHAERVIAWALVAGALAALVYPAVEFGARWLPRGVVVFLLVVLGLSAIGFVSYRIVNAISERIASADRTDTSTCGLCADAPLTGDPPVTSVITRTIST